jgi:hypothetical protein
MLAAAAIVLDVGVIGDQTLGRRAVNLACPQAPGCDVVLASGS